ncbi:MAG TPA: hypothetical protein P5107_06390 [Thermotogota bacterium]|nr:hypothetical protein [Thermotogota bacterium]HRW34664.1 hypothetical protein [Thermotogota bacterium]
MYLKGSGIEDILSNMDIDEISKGEDTLIYSIFDEQFDYTSIFISGAPSAHLVIEKKKEDVSILFFLDLKSVSFSFSPEDTLNIPISEKMTEVARKIIWKNATVICTKTPSIEFILDEIKFFSDYNIHILGYASTSQQRFQEIETLVDGIPTSFTPEETEKTHYNALLINLIAVESNFYEMDNNCYLIPTVGMDGMELWLGTNPRFFLDIVNDKDDELQRETKKFLYHIIFSRIAKEISEHFSIHHYSVSKVEIGFVIDQLKKESILEFLKIIKAINTKAKDFFNTVLNENACNAREIEKDADTKLKLLKAFYDEKDIIGVITAAYSNEEEQHRQMLEMLLKKDIPRIITGIQHTVQDIDKLIKKCIEEGGQEIELF